MAGRIILGTANPSLDGNGNPVAGSTWTFYQNQTTTLQSVFTAIDLLTPLANPLTCDASGEFPQIWAPDSTPYSVKWSRPGEADVTFDNIFPLSLASGNNYRLVDVVATSNIALAGGLANGQTIDGQLLATGMRVLLTAQTTGSENGIYDSPVSGTASRSADSNSTASLPNGVMLIVQRGTSFKDSIWLHTTPVGFTLGVTALTFVSPARIQTRQIFTAGSGATYTTAPGVRQLRIRMYGGGGGGGGGGDSGSHGGNGGAGGTSLFNGIQANGGSFGGGATGVGGSNGGNGGSGGSGSASFRIAGQAGNAGSGAPNPTIGSANGGSGGGQGGGNSNQAGATNSGAGGGGGGVSGTSTGGSGGGGGQGEYLELIINAPAATYTYTVGTGGAAGTAGAGSAGGAGAAGIIIVEEV